MEFLRSLVVILCIPAILVVYAMYFSSLYELSRTLEQESPELLDTVVKNTLNRPKKFHAAYTIFSKQKNGIYMNYELGPRSAASLPSLKRLLYTGAGLFVAFTLAMLTDPSVYSS